MKYGVISEMKKTMDALHFSEEDKNAMVQNLTTHSGRKRMGFGGRKLTAVALAAAMLVVMLTGAAAYSGWSNSMQSYYNPSEQAKAQAENSGLSVVYDAGRSADGSVLSAADQGITVSVVQSIVNQTRADIILRVEGFTPPEGNDLRPEVWMNPATLDGNLHFSASRGASFFNGVVTDLDGNDIYEDGTPVVLDENGWQVGRYIRNDGSLELVLTYIFRATSGDNLGKEIQLHITDFGYARFSGMTELAQEKMVTGNWDLHWVLNGTDSVMGVELNVPFTEHVTLLRAEIGQTYLKAYYQGDTHWNGLDPEKFFQPTIAGVKLRNGILISFAPMKQGYEDEAESVFYVESQSHKGMVEMDQIEALVFVNRQVHGAPDIQTTPDYLYIQVP